MRIGVGTGAKISDGTSITTSTDIKTETKYPSLILYLIFQEGYLQFSHSHSKQHLGFWVSINSLQNDPLLRRYLVSFTRLEVVNSSIMCVILLKHFKISVDYSKMQ